MSLRAAFKALVWAIEPEALDEGTPPATALSEVQAFVSFLEKLRKQAEAVTKKNRCGSYGIEINYLDLDSLPDVTAERGEYDFIGPGFSLGESNVGHDGGYVEFDSVHVPVLDLIGGEEGKRLREAEKARVALLQARQAHWQAYHDHKTWADALAQTIKDLASGEIGGKKSQRTKKYQQDNVRKAKAKLEGSCPRGPGL